MSEKEWDNIIKGKLAGMKSSTDGADWDSLRTKMIEVDDAYFDTKVKETLQDHIVPVKIGHWEELRAKLLHNKQVAERIARFKTLEILVVLLLFQGWNALYHNSCNTGLRPHGIQQPIAQVEKTENLHGVHESSTSLNNVQTIVTPTTNDVFADSPRSSIAYHPSTTVTVSREIPVIDNVSNTELKAVTSIHQHTATAVTNHHESNSTPAEESIVDRQTTTVETLASIASEIVYTRSGMHIPTLLPSKKSSEIGLHIGRALLTVQSPYDKVYNIRAYSKVATTFEYGINYMRSRYRWKYGIGLSYSSFSYSPQKVYENLITRNTHTYKIALNVFKYHTISIPLELTYNIIQHKRSQLGIGLIVNPTLNVTSNYYAVIKNKQNQLVFDNTDYKTFSFAQEPAFLTQKDFDSGFWDSGDLPKNLQLYGGLQLSYNYQLSDRFGLSVKGSYLHPFSAGGLGPNQDKVSKLTASIGTSFLF